MKITQYAFLMIWLPAATMLVLVVSVLCLVTSIERDATGDRSSSFAAGCDELSNSLYAESAALLLMQQTDADFAYDRFKYFREQTSSCLEKLQAMGKDQPELAKDIMDLRLGVDSAQTNLDESFRLVLTGQTAPPYRDRLASLKSGFNYVNGKLSNLSAKYRQQLQTKVSQKTQTVKALLVVAGTTSLIAAVVFAITFGRGVKRRLTAVLDNIYNFERQSGVQHTEQSKDEIANIDSTFYSMARIITDKTEQLRAAEARVRAALEGLALGALVLSSDWKINYANPAIRNLLGVLDDSLTGRNFAEFVTTKDGEPIVLDSSFKKTTEVFMRSANATFAAEVTVNDCVGPDGPCYIVSVQDIRERHEMELMRRELSAMISHDLRTPLTSIRLIMDLVVNGAYGKLDERGKHQIDNARHSCRRLLSLINELLDMEKLRRDGCLELNLAPASVHGFVEESMTAVAPLADAREVRLSMDVDTEQELVVDRDRIIQVLINLVSNAIKFSPSGGLVEIKAKQLEDCCEIEVSDEGRGIPESKIATIFESFTQVSSEDGRNERGMGLGLAICKSIVASHSGEIGVRSQLGVGSTFWLRIPIPQAIDDLDDEVTETTPTLS